ncbi:MAG: preprotein translocase subunit SecG [Deltaproteobacteria bacterium]|nr:preprotein translocase subunit SecG [Deltaproteobacteria bacterium]MBI3295130.1 preprotein translocase subunit SecG [Deltaproteobacteria bacterium]
MTALLVFHFVICAFLVFVILLQPGKSDGGGIGFGSSSQSIFGSRGAGNFLTKVTSFCALTFLLTSFILTRARMREYTTSVISGSEPAAEATSTPAPKPVESAKPTPDGAGKK